MRGVLLWLIGIPIPIIILLYLSMSFNGNGNHGAYDDSNSKGAGHSQA